MSGANDGITDAARVEQPDSGWWVGIWRSVVNAVLPLVLALIFYLIVAPVAIVMRLAKRNPLARAFDRTAASYRIPSIASPRENLEKTHR